MAEIDQSKPLAPRNRTDEDKALSEHLKFHHSRRKPLLYCGVFAATIIILAVIIIILSFTIFQIHNPKITLNSVAIQRLGSLNGTFPTDLTLLADISVKNPNIAAFRFPDSNTEIYYYGVEVGKGRYDRGVAEARRTLRRNVTVEIVTAEILAVPNFVTDLGLGVLNFSSFTRIPGKVRILGFVKRSVVVRMNCTMSYNVSGQAFQDQNCRSHLDL